MQTPYSFKFTKYLYLSIVSYLPAQELFLKYSKLSKVNRLHMIESQLLPKSKHVGIRIPDFYIHLDSMDYLLSFATEITITIPKDAHHFLFF